MTTKHKETETNQKENKETQTTTPNYFEAVNKSFEDELLKGNSNKETIQEIKERNKTSFFSKIVDAIKNPEEAIKWLKTSTIISIGGSWLKSLFGLDNKIEEKKEEIMHTIEDVIIDKKIDKKENTPKEENELNENETEEDENINENETEEESEYDNSFNYVIVDTPPDKNDLTLETYGDYNFNLIEKTRYEAEKKYGEFFELLSDQKKLIDFSEIKFQRLVEKLIENYKDDTATWMRHLIEYQDFINEAFLSKSPEERAKGVTILDGYLRLEWSESKKKVYLSHGTESEFREYLYALKDMPIVTSDILAKQNISEEIGGNFIPIYGSLRDYSRAFRNVDRGNYGQATADTAWAIGGFILDYYTLGKWRLFGGGIKNASKIKHLEKIFILFNSSASLGLFGKTTVQHFLRDENSKSIFSSKYFIENKKNAPPVPTVIGGSNDKLRVQIKLDFHEDIINTTETSEEKIENIKHQIDNIINLYQWSQTYYEIIDENTVKIFRRRSDAETVIKKEANGKWNLEGDLKTNLGYEKFEQAFILGNLSNTTMEWLCERDRGERAKSNTPFYIDKTINYSRSWPQRDSNYISEKWLSVYNMMYLINNEEILTLLNNTYNKWKKNPQMGKIEEIENELHNETLPPMGTI